MARHEMLLAVMCALRNGKAEVVDEYRRGRRRFLVVKTANLAVLALDALTDKERPVACMAALGLANKEIAFSLGIATSTAASRLQSAMKKLGVPARAALVRRLCDGRI